MSITSPKPLLTKMITWKDVSERDRCLVGTPAGGVADRPNDSSQRYTPGIWPWCYLRLPGCKTRTINRDCLTREQHMELLATPKGFSWTGVRGLREVLEKCGEPSPYDGDQSDIWQDKINENDYGIKTVNGASKNQNKTSLTDNVDKAKNLKSNQKSKKGMTTELFKDSSSDVTGKIAKTTKHDQKFMKETEKTANNGTNIKTLHKNTIKLNPGQKSERTKAKALNDDSSSETTSDNANKSSYGQKKKKEIANKIVKDTNMQQKTVKKMKTGHKQIKDNTDTLNGDSSSEMKNKNAAKPKHGQRNKKDNAKTEDKASKTQRINANKLKAGQKQNKDNTKTVNGDSSSEMKNKNAAKPKQGQRNKKDNTKTDDKASGKQRINGKRLKPGQIPNKDKTKALNGETSAKVKSGNATTSEPDQKFRNSSTKTGTGVTPSNTRDQTTNKTPDQTFKNDTAYTGTGVSPLNTRDQTANKTPDRAVKNDTTNTGKEVTPSKTQDRTTSENPDRMFDDGTAKTGTGVTTSKTQDGTATTPEPDRTDKKSLRSLDFKIPKKQCKPKKRFVFERPDADKTKKGTGGSDDEKKSEPEEKKNPLECTKQFEEPTETEAEDQESCFEKEPKPAPRFKNMIRHGCTNNIQESAMNKSSRSANTTYNQCIRYKIRKVDGSEFILNRVTDPRCKHNNP